MPKSGEVRINGAQVFINDVSVSLRAIPPVVVKRKDMSAPAPKPAPRAPAKARPKPGATKHGKSGTRPAGGTGSAQKHADRAKYWAAHPQAYKEWARASHKDHTDCGVFIGEVMHDSGSDPHYPAGGAAVQWDYVHDPKNGWTVGDIGDGGPQPGDVLLRHPYKRASERVVGHTGLYVGPDPNNPADTVIDEASLGSHGPQPSDYSSDGIAHFSDLGEAPRRVRARQGKSGHHESVTSRAPRQVNP